MYIHLSSKDSLEAHPNNHGADFTVNLGKTLNFPGNYKVALTEIDYDGKKGDVYIFADIASTSFVRDSYLPILRVTDRSKTFTHRQYVPLAQESISQIRIYIRDRRYREPSVPPKFSRCTLHITKKG